MEREVRRLRSSKKRQPRSTTTIENLPESILWYIVSLLPYCDAVRTGVLSKKWKNLWCSRTSWDLDFSEFPRNRNRETRFEIFVSKIIRLHIGPGTQYVRLKYHYQDPRRVGIIYDWIEGILRHQVIGLYVSIIEPAIPPLPLFESQSLVDLRLDLDDGEFTIPPTVTLPHLRSLYLEHVRFSYTSAFERLITGCPVLSNLHMEKCGFFYFFMDGDLNISHPSLEDLTFDTCYGIEDTTLHINTPNLSKLRYKGRGFVKKENDFKDLSSLNTVILELREYRATYIHWSPEEITANRVRYMCQLLSAIRNTSSILLSETCIEYLSMATNLVKLPLFDKLEVVTASMWPNEGHAYVISQMLGCCPALKHLEVTVTEFDVPGVLNEERSRYPQRPDYLSKDMFHYNLRRVDMRKLTGREDELRLIRFLLQNAVALECFTVSTKRWNNKEKRRQFANAIHSYPRASQVKIRIY